MKQKFIEACQTPQGPNWGKFAVFQWEPTDWAYESAVDVGASLLRSRGRNPDSLLVVDLETNEGAWFRPGGSVEYDIRKKRIWVCVMFGSLLQWLYNQATEAKKAGRVFDIDDLPPVVYIPDTIDAASYRRPGPCGHGRLRRGDCGSNRKPLHVNGARQSRDHKSRVPNAPRPPGGTRPE